MTLPPVPLAMKIIATLAYIFLIFYPVRNTLREGRDHGFDKYDAVFALIVVLASAAILTGVWI